MVCTSARNCFSPCPRHFSLLTATAAEPGNVPLKTQPKPPSPSFSENFFVEFFICAHEKTTRLPFSYTLLALNNFVLHLHKTARPLIITMMTNAAIAVRNRGAALKPEFSCCCLVATRMYKRLPFEPESSTTVFSKSQNHNRHVTL
uniref:Uncharacterized protein n=1 Tax=Triticum urartu TaxID=4572 RepID=A0A8R7QPF4_TRIUA